MGSFRTHRLDPDRFDPLYPYRWQPKSIGFVMVEAFALITMTCRESFGSSKLVILTS